MKVIHIGTGVERIISAEKWAKIQANGFAHLYRVLKEPEMPQEVAEHIGNAKTSKQKINKK